MSGLLILVGAVAMTVGVFLPAFAFSLIFYDRLEAVVENKRLHAFLDGVAAGVVGLIGATTIDLAQVTANRVPSLTVGMSIFAAALAFLYAWKNKLNVVVVILAAGLTGCPRPSRPTSLGPSRCSQPPASRGPRSSFAFHLQENARRALQQSHC